MNVAGSEEAVVGRGVMLGEIIGIVVGAFAPVDNKVALVDAIFDPIKSHVHGLGATLAYCVIYDASGACVIGLNGGG